MKRILLVLVVAVIGGLGLAYYKITSKVKEGLDNANASMSMMGAGLKYGGVSVSFDGDVRVNDLRFFGPGGQEVHIDQVAMGTGNPLDLLELSSRLQKRQVPDSVNLGIKGFTMDLDNILPRSSSDSTSSDNPLQHFEAVGCGDKRFFDVDDWKAMGYSQIRWDMDFAYEIKDGGTQLEVRANLGSEDQMAIRLEAVFSQSLSMNHVTVTPDLIESVRLVSGRVAYEDKGYMTRTMELCARETGLDMAAYRNHHLQAWRNVWANKLQMTPSENISTVYQDYIDNPGNTITLEIEPYPPLDMSDNYLSSNPEYLSQRLNPKIGTDNIALAPFTVSSADAPETTSTTSTQASPEPSATAQATSSSPAAITVATLNQHLNEDVLLILTDGRTLDGRVQSVNAGKLLLRRHLYGGLMDVPVELRTIKAVRKQ